MSYCGHDLRFDGAGGRTLVALGQPLFNFDEHSRGRRSDADMHRRHQHVDDHRKQRESDEHVDRRRDEEVLVVGNDVAETDRAQRDAREVERLEVGPALPRHVHERAEQRVRDADEDGDDGRQVELVVDLVRNARLVVAVGAAGGTGLGPRRPLSTSHGAPEAASAAPQLVPDALQQRHAQSADRDHAAHASTAARIVEPAHEHPQVFDGARQQLADAGQHDETQRNSDESVDDGDDAADEGDRHHVPVACSNASRSVPQSYFMFFPN